MYKGIIVIGVAAAACLVAGCGDSGEETAEAAMTKAQFIKQAKAICGEARAEMQNAAAAWERANGKPLDLDTAFKKILAPALEQEAEKLQTLTAPRPDGARLARMLDTLSEVAIAAGQGKTSSPVGKKFRQEAEAYGLDACLL